MNREYASAERKIDMTDAALEASKKIKKHVVKTGLHTYKLTLPETVFGDLQHLAEEEHTTVLELIRRAIRFYLALDILEQEPGTEIILRRPGKPDERIFFLM